MVIFRPDEAGATFSAFPGTHKIFFVGGFRAYDLNDLVVQVSKVDNQMKVKVSRTHFDTTTLIDWKKAVACYKFEIEEAGEYRIEFYNWEQLELRKSGLLLMNLLFPSKVGSREIVVAIQ